VSNTESFIDEVTEEVRRDRLFAYMRRYGWIAVVVVLGVVGSAGWTEYTRAKATAEAQAKGDAILAAFEVEDDAERLAALAALPQSEVGAFLAASEYQITGDAAAAAATLDALAANPDVPQTYRDIAAFKSALAQADTLEPEALKSLFAPLAIPGSPLRLLAMEQIALADLKAGDQEAAIAGMNAILEDAGVTRGLRDRLSSLIVALGGEVVPAAGAAVSQ
jgi:hypothetical protein